MADTAAALEKLRAAFDDPFHGLHDVLPPLTELIDEAVWKAQSMTRVLVDNGMPALADCIAAIVLPLHKATTLLPRSTFVLLPDGPEDCVGDDQ